MESRPRQRIVTFLMAGFLLFAFVLGCRQFARKDFSNSRRRGVNSNSAPGKTSDGLTEKTNLYIKDCINEYSNSVMDSYRRYASWLRDLEKGPTGNENVVYGLYDIHGDAQRCLDAISKAKAMGPEMPEVESSAEAYAAALKEAVAQIKAIYPYYDHEDYKDDKFQKGKNAHPALLKAFKEFEQANKSFDAQVDKMEDAVAHKRLDELSGDSSKRYQYMVVDTGIKSKNIMRVVRQTEFSQIKVDDLQPLIDDFEKAVTDLKTAAGANPLSSLYVSSCDDFLKAAKELMRRVRDKKPFSDFERRELGTGGGWMIDGSPDKLIHTYNEMISRRGTGV